MIIWLDCHRRRDSTCCSALGISSYRLPYGTVTGVIRTDNILHPASEVFDGAVTESNSRLGHYSSAD